VVPLAKWAYFLPALAFGEALAPALAFVDFGAALAAVFVTFAVVFAAMSVGSCITGTGYLYLEKCSVVPASERRQTRVLCEKQAASRVPAVAVCGVRVATRASAGDVQSVVTNPIRKIMLCGKIPVTPSVK
jgi:hypothetical protein